VSYYTDENDEEDRPEIGKKFDFTKPRPTRAFALSKAAATKKLLTATATDRFKYKPKTQTPQRLTQRNVAQFRSVRLTNVNKGDSLAYITDKKMQKNPSVETKNDRILKKDESGLNEKMTTLKKLSPIKLRSKKGEAKTNEKSNDSVKGRQLFRKSLLIDEESEEANDVLASTSTGYSSSSSYFAYDNPAVDFSADDVKADQRTVRKSHLVSTRIENLPVDGRDEENSDEGGNSDAEESSPTTAAEYATYNVRTQSIISNSPDCAPSDATLSSSPKRRSLSLDEYQTNFEPNEPLKQACEITDGYLKKPEDFPANVKPQACEITDGYLKKPEDFPANVKPQQHGLQNPKAKDTLHLWYRLLCTLV
uniref:Uncharacterized protein n=1 Tax=Romanomermis culicivorax TaxID=13658 RepID=A0A915KQT6_ROMCU